MRYCGVLYYYYLDWRVRDVSSFFIIVRFEVQNLMWYFVSVSVHILSVSQGQPKTNDRLMTPLMKRESGEVDYYVRRK
jgi:hypothetical protein